MPYESRGLLCQQQLSSNHGVLEWPLVKVAALARKCVTIQDNHHHIERPLDAGPKFQHIRCRTHYASRRFRPGSTLARTVYTGRHLILSSSNCPVLDAWAKLYVQTALVLLGAYLRPRIRRRRQDPISRVRNYC